MNHPISINMIGWLYFYIRNETSKKKKEQHECINKIKKSDNHHHNKKNSKMSKYKGNSDKSNSLKIRYDIL